MTVAVRPYTLVSVVTDSGIGGWSYVGGSPVVAGIVDELRDMLVGEPVDIPRLWNKSISSDRFVPDRGGSFMCAVFGIRGRMSGVSARRSRR